MSAARTRFLRPSVLALLPSGLWAVDEFHPVAAVLDPDTGKLRRVVSWPEVPPGPWDTGGYMPLVHSDGTGLWVQHDRQGPLVRIDEDGLGVVAWTDGLELEACGPGVAWCASRDEGRLLRVDRDGHATPVETRGRIDQIGTSPDALLVQLVAAPPAVDGSGITWPSGWVGLPWNGEVPCELADGGHSVPEVDEPDWDAAENADWDGVGKRNYSWHELPPRPSDVATDRHRWCLGWRRNLELPRPTYVRRPLLATAHTPDGAEVRRWELGRGEVLSTRSLGDRLAVTVARPGGSSEVLALHPGTNEVTVLLATDAVDITGLGWPIVPRPVAADSYATQVRAREEVLHFFPGELSDVRATLVGEWPDIQLERTFRWTGRPGLVLRRRVRLFDELGRIANPGLAYVYLMETMETNGVPLAEDAVDGYLDL